jgi:two-component system chemotaxis response regulator CheB
MRHFVSTVKLMSEVKLIKRWNRSPYVSKSEEQITTSFKNEKEVNADFNIIAIGASAGGPMAVKEILDHLNVHLSVPIIIVQHIDQDFTQGYADWLNLTSGVKVVIAKDGEVMEPGRAYMAPGDYHIGVKSLNSIHISKELPESGLRPSVSFLFRSIRKVYRNKVLAILLSGMGADGAYELKLLKDEGSTTIAQDALSSLIHGMPGEAIKLGAASHILSPAEIAVFIQKCIPTLTK